jgi:hypothetical protein
MSPAQAPSQAPTQTNGREPAMSSAGPPTEEAIDDLKRKLDELQGQLSQLSKKP